jgi:putative membrane protein
MTGKVKPYEEDAAATRLAPLPGDRPLADSPGAAQPPVEYDIAEARFLAQSPEPRGRELAPRRRRIWTRGTIFSLFALLFALGFLTYHSVRSVIDAFAWWAPSGILLGALLSALVLSGLLALGQELRIIRRQLRTLGSLKSARAEADLLTESAGHDRGVAFAARLIAMYESRPDMAGPIQAFRQSIHSGLRDQEVVARLSSHVLRHLDDDARESVGRALRDTAFISLASPNGLVDSLITLWRELKMLREIATIYGLAPGLLQQWTLLRRVVSIAATSGLANQAGDMAVQSLGGGLIGRLSANAADSLYTALRTARLGIYAMEVCRPVTFVAEERRGMWAFLRKAARSLVSLLESRVGSGGVPDRSAADS